MFLSLTCWLVIIVGSCYQLTKRDFLRLPGNIPLVHTLVISSFVATFGLAMTGLFHSGFNYAGPAVLGVFAVSYALSLIVKNYYRLSVR